MLFIVEMVPDRKDFNQFRETLRRRMGVIPKGVKIIGAYIHLPCKKDTVILEAKDEREVHEFLIPFVPVTSTMDLSVARTWEEVSTYDFYPDIEKLLTKDWFETVKR